MNINDYLIPASQLDWEKLLADWKWKLQKSYTVWMVNLFGDLVLVDDKNGKVRLLDIGSGSLEKLADSRDRFFDRIEKEDFAETCFKISLVDKCLAEGLVPGKSECYSFKISPSLGGEFSPENIEVTDLAVHYSLFGQLHEQLKDLPKGTKIGQVKMVEGEG